ncbi:hypothetical protein [Flavobacterium terrigena]|uniref:Uncharacterized protein n=1 Tax=Flavobacterium terrigena TaxID=402734 RepID=A0A1H6W2T0_9FLAO|nr:hypothetical protein [Flavobacterium terrigena]SEJ10156.1 hypothetical protein SAMN05660918_2370 [Flavobacterium terrigena]
MKHFEKIQTLLPLGYLYLVILGIIKETAFFYQLDINILKYSSIMDVLISPIATLTSNPIVFIIITIILISSFYLPDFLFKNDHKNWVRKIFELKKTKTDLGNDEIKNYYLFISIKFLAVFLLSVYLGYGVGEGYTISNRIKDNKLKYEHKLNYATGESEIVSLLETNSLYYFYVEKGKQSVKIAPIGGIKNIEIIY